MLKLPRTSTLRFSTDDCTILLEDDSTAPHIDPSVYSGERNARSAPSGGSKKHQREGGGNRGSSTAACPKSSTHVPAQMASVGALWPCRIQDDLSLPPFHGLHACGQLELCPVT
eukprot:3794255-Amphidinium_carterae.2